MQSIILNMKCFEIEQR